MKKKILIICNTYFQLITAIQLKCTLKKNDNVTVILSDHSQNTENISKKLNHANVFEKIIFLKCKDLDYGKHRMIDGVHHIIDGILDQSPIKESFLDQRFDEFLYYNLNMSTVSIYGILRKNNRNMKCSKYEEGILSYDNEFHMNEIPKRLKLICLIRKLLLKTNLQTVTDKFYCFSPEVYHGNLQIRQIPLIDISGEIKEILLKIFPLENALNYNYKYIFFASTLDEEGGDPIGEFRLLQDVRNLVGNDNLLVKIHPRMCKEKYIEAGFHVDINSFIPWEAIQIQCDFSNHIFLTVVSGSVLSINSIIQNPAKTFFLYPLCKESNNTELLRNIKTFEHLRQHNLFNFACIIHDLKNIEQ